MIGIDRFAFLPKTLLNYFSMMFCSRFLRKSSLALFFVFLSVSSLLALDRRRDQFPTDFGYLVAPIPYILPGAGAGLGVLGGFNNIPFGSTETTVDVFAVGIGGGNITGTIAGITDIPLWPETLLLDLTSVNFNKGTQKVYRSRGMDPDSDPEDFFYTELTDTHLQGGRLILTLAERMFEVFTIQYDIDAATSGILDNEGERLYTYDPPQRFKFQSRSYGTQVDWTDDRTDPHKGLRFVYTRSSTPSNDESTSTLQQVEYYTQDYNTTAYLPLWGSSNLALNYYRSMAVVQQQGETDVNVIYSELKSEQCANGCSAVEEAALYDTAQDQATTNRYGTAGSLGGSSRLRSFAGGRFSGAQVGFRAAEFRWNITDENTPFDLYFIRDVRTGFQLAFFYEEGSVADTESDLWSQKRTSTGVGARLVTSSGFVYRFDVANGEEGSEVILFIDYPWGTISQ